MAYFGRTAHLLTSRLHLKSVPHSRNQSLVAKFKPSFEASKSSYICRTAPNHSKYLYREFHKCSLVLSNTSSKQKNAPEEEEFEEFEDIEEWRESEYDEFSEPSIQSRQYEESNEMRSARGDKPAKKYEPVGVAENGMTILRPTFLDPSTPTKLVEKLIPTLRKGKIKNYQAVLVETPLKDSDLDELDLTPKPEPPLDFSLLFSASNDLSGLFNTLEQKHDLHFVTYKDSVIQAFESSVFGNQVKPMDVSCHAIGKELLELHVIDAVSRTYPNLPYNGLIKVTSMASGNNSLARALLGLKLEPFIQLVPNYPISKFPDPALTCLQVSSNAYISLIGAVYSEFGFERASNFLYSTLKLEKLDASDLKRLQILPSMKDAKITLHKLLFRLRLPLPIYYMEDRRQLFDQAKPGEIVPVEYTAVVKSGPKILGRAVAQSKILAEQRAAADALYNHWSMQLGTAPL